MKRLKWSKCFFSLFLSLWRVLSRLSSAQSDAMETTVEKSVRLPRNTFSTVEWMVWIDWVSSFYEVIDFFICFVLFFLPRWNKCKKREWWENRLSLSRSPKITTNLIRMADFVRAKMPVTLEFIHKQILGNQIIFKLIHEYPFLNFLFCMNIIIMIVSFLSILLWWNIPWECGAINHQRMSTIRTRIYINNKNQDGDFLMVHTI